MVLDKPCDLATGDNPGGYNQRTGRFLESLVLGHLNAFVDILQVKVLFRNVFDLIRSISKCFCGEQNGPES